MDVFRNSSFNFMRARHLWLVVSLVLVGVSLFGLVVRQQLNVGIDFAGGTQLTLRFREQPDLDRLRGALTGVGLDAAALQRYGSEGDHEVLIRTPVRAGQDEGSAGLVEQALDQSFGQSGESFDLNRRGRDALANLLLAADPDQKLAAGEEAARSHYQSVADAVVGFREQRGLLSSVSDLASVDGLSEAARRHLESVASAGGYTVLSRENVGSQIGAELRRKGVLAVVLSILAMLGYIWVRFELRFGVGAVVAMVHDVLITLGAFAYANYEFNLSTVAAFLTVVGYSVNDSVVVFDRVRENMRRNRREPLIDVLNRSLNQTLSRTILTGGSTLLAVGALFFLGGEVIRGFAFVLLIGIVVGTYSSIFIASPWVLVWERWFGRDRESKLRRNQAA